LSNVIGAVLATFITVPYIVFFIVHMSMYRMTRKKRKALKISTDVTTFFLFLAIERMTVEIWGNSYYWVLILLFIGGCLIFTLFIWKNDLDLSIGKIIRMNWRLQFLLLSIGYFSLLTFGIIDRILSA
jgi:asparagine N-glycosylation enzyme membrane subunit Stt3